MKSAKKSSRMSTGGGNSRRVSVGGNTVQTARPDSSQSARGTPSSRPSKKDDNTGTPQSTGKFLGHCRFLEAKSSVPAHGSVFFLIMQHTYSVYKCHTCKAATHEFKIFRGKRVHQRPLKK